MSKFEVRVARTVIETTVITVDALNEIDAEALALNVAPEVSDDQWSLYESSAEAIDTFEIES